MSVPALTERAAVWALSMPDIPAAVAIITQARTRPTLWSEGGSGSSGFSSMLIYITRKNGAFFPNYGRVLHDQSHLWRKGGRKAESGIYL